ncbi:helix-turn-helix domain-containing protein [Paenibacillus sp. 598K]|uniref:helix-turn-helix domain-containing protein n=1 Tax=Paenibacillus sp. 598K TaxID=1117987 RepID=UPI001623D86C|nr:helix-turn-helix domain-containing protein [Paenibacillus sp. 598K]
MFILLDVRQLGPLDAGSQLSRTHLLLYITDGNGALETDGERTPLHRDSCYMIAPDRPYSISHDPQIPLQGYALAFDAVRISGFAANEPALRREGASFGYCGEVYWYEPPAIAASLAELYETRGQSGPLQQFRRQRTFLDALEQVWRQIEQAPAKPDTANALQRAIDYMEQAYEQDLTRELLAERAQMSPGYFSSAFRKRTGKSPMDMLAEIRVRHAKELLLTSDAPLREIAQAVGYSSEFYFSSRFKQFTGLPPSAYAKRSRSRKVASSELYTQHLLPKLRPAEAPAPGSVVGLFLEDHLAALGITPPVQYARSGYYQRYLASALGDVERWDVAHPDFERLRQVRPDRILLGFSSFAADGRYEQFAAIAPTYVFQQPEADWRATLRLVGELVGRAEAAEQALASYERAARAAREQLARAIGRQTVAFLRIHLKQGLCLYGAAGGYVGPVLYEDLRLSMPPLLQEWIAKHQTPVIPIAPEALALLEADHLILVIDDGQAGQAESLMASPAWRRLAAVRHRRVYLQTTDVWMSFGLLAHTRKIEALLGALAPTLDRSSLDGDDEG